MTTEERELLKAEVLKELLNGLSLDVSSECTCYGTKYHRVTLKFNEQNLSYVDINMPEGTF